MSDKLPKVEVTATAWDWECPNEECERGNYIDEKDIDWMDPPWTAKCQQCGLEVELDI